MKLYNSFKQLIANLTPLSSLLTNSDKYLAHTPKRANQEAERLCVHIEKVNVYALKLIEVHSLDAVADKLIYDIINNQPEFQNKELLGNYIKLLFIQSIVFHDYGKINPNFQSVKMSNPLFSYDKKIKIDSQHSKLSAFLYIHFHLKEISVNALFKETEKSFLWAMTFLFANPILKHHSSYFEHSINFEDNEFKSLNRFLSDIKIQFEGEVFFKNLNGEEGLLDYFKMYYSFENYFPVFALLKLNFSLLTASDYYATNAYTNEFEVDDFGLIDDNLRSKINFHFWEMEKFVNGKDNYNNTLFKNFEFFKNLSFDDLNKASTKNLNLLRQKLTAEVIANTQASWYNNLFYLEAPTGAGKTNLSIAIAIELLKSNPELNKIFYIFPFTTLISQTFSAIKDTLGLNNSEIIQLHSKAGFHEKNNAKEKDALYGIEKLNFIDNLFINYPITLFSHIRFFDILKGNSKETNYILHRLSNSIIIIDELQSYNPKHWDKVIFYLSNYARYFNFKVVLMSATLPKLNDLDKKLRGNIISLVHNKNSYFLNPNFKDRIIFSFDLLKWQKPNSKADKEKYLNKLKDFLYEKAQEYAKRKDGKVNVIIEFIKKKTASEFTRLINADRRFLDYHIFLISGEILEPRRKHIIDIIKKKELDKALLISTQVVESGVDIDMDLGFKDKSLIDSDEQLAGRVNRNAGKTDCIVYIFNADSEADIYGKDERYKITKEQIDQSTYQEILETKNFDKLYDLVNEKINHRNENPYHLETLPEYLTHFKNFTFSKADKAFQLIEEANTSVFVPLFIPQKHFTKEDLKTMEYFDIRPDKEGNINGKDVWQKYETIILGKGDKEYMQNQIEFKKIGGLLLKFMFPVYDKQAKELREFCDMEVLEKYGILYLSRWDTSKIYSYEEGIDISKINSDNFL